MKSSVLAATRGLFAVALFTACSASVFAQMGGGGGGGGTGGGGGGLGGTGGAGGGLGGTGGALGAQSAQGTDAVTIRDRLLNPVPMRDRGMLSPSSTQGAIGAGARTAARGTTRGATAIGGARVGGAAGLGGLGARGGLGGRLGAATQTATGTNQIRVPVRIADTTLIARAPPNVAVSRFRERLPHLPGMANVNVTMVAEGRTVVLRGAVASASQRELLIRLVLLEPGISSVQDELDIAAPPPAPELLPSSAVPAAEAL